MAEPTFFERYRNWIIAGAAVIGVVVIGYFLFVANRGPQGNFAAVGNKYVCDTLMTPGPSETLPATPRSFAPTPTPVPTPTLDVTPAPSPSAAPSGSAVPSSSGAIATDGSGTPLPSASAAPTASLAPSSSTDASPGASAGASASPSAEPTLRLGFSNTIQGFQHVSNPNQTIQYGFCPPSSGDHYNVAGFGPIRAAVYPNTAEQPPGGWVHNLEHGWVVVLYSCKDSCPSADEMAQMTQWFNEAPAPDPAQGCNKEVLVARFDGMTTRFAQLAWGRALMSDTFDLDTANTFTKQWMDAGTEREKGIC